MAVALDLFDSSTERRMPVDPGLSSGKTELGTSYRQCQQGVTLFEHERYAVTLRYDDVTLRCVPGNSAVGEQRNRAQID